MLDVALVSLIEDLIEKAGADGVIEFWQRVGENLANRIGKEAYMGWTSFNVPLDAVCGAPLPHGDVEGGPAHVRLLADPVREVLADPLPELDHAVRAGFLDEVLDQRHERDVQH